MEQLAVYAVEPSRKKQNFIIKKNVLGQEHCCL